MQSEIQNHEIGIVTFWQRSTRVLGVLRLDCKWCWEALHWQWVYTHRAYSRAHNSFYCILKLLTTTSIKWTRQNSLATMGDFTFWITLLLSPKFGLSPKLSQKVSCFFSLWL